jgi:hypothetical protein
LETLAILPAKKMNHMSMIETEVMPGTLHVRRSDDGTPVDLPAYRKISAEQSRLLRYNYRDNALVRNSAAIGQKDSTSTWLSRELLLMLADACEGLQNCVDGSDGVMGHWASYPVDYRNKDLAGRHTVVFEVKSFSGEPEWFEGPILCPPWCGDPAPCPDKK